MAWAQQDEMANASCWAAAAAAAAAGVHSPFAPAAGEESRVRRTPREKGHTVRLRP